MTDWDVVIVGAGPVGGYAAYKLAEMGHRIRMVKSVAPSSALDWSLPKRCRELDLSIRY